MIVESIIVLVIAVIKITASRFILFHSSAEEITKQRPKETCWRGIQKEKKENSERGNP